MVRLVLSVSLAGLVACASGPVAPRDVPAHRAAPVATPAVAPIPPAPKSAPPAASTAPAPLNVSVERVLQGRVTAIALGDGNRVAALADEPYVGAGHSLRQLALPTAFRIKVGEAEQLGIYFGRDNEPRIMGQRRTSAGDVAVYWRHLSSGWRDGREEIGQLGGTTRGALWGVLGGADPELVCRTGAVCIIKRTSGWTTVAAGATQRIVVLQDGVLWGLDASGIAGIDKHGWALAIPAPNWSEPKAFWATAGEAWVSAGGQLFHYESGSWHLVPSPVGEVYSFWGARRDSIWIAGSVGAAHFDGRGLRAVAIIGPLRAVLGRSDGEVWFGGDAGLFRAQAPR